MGRVQDTQQHAKDLQKAPSKIQEQENRGGGWGRRGVESEREGEGEGVVRVGALLERAIFVGLFRGKRASYPFGASPSPRPPPVPRNPCRARHVSTPLTIIQL